MFEALKWPNFCVNVYLLKSGHFVSRQWSSISHLFWKMNFNPCRFRLDCNFKSKFEIYILLISFVNLRELISYRIGGFCKLLPFPVKAFAVFCPLPMHYNKTKYFASWECIRQCLMYSYFFSKCGRSTLYICLSKSCCHRVGSSSITSLILQSQFLALIPLVVNQ